ncbi:MAG: septal ring lytic transglycosylase RlpA family protein [Candidatus Gracilibacteria bacterium]|jgi:rare lipoprotein A (peptidoglycan hydrolase)
MKSKSIIRILFFILIFSFLAPITQAGVLPFSDIEEGTKYYDAIADLYEQEIITGYSDNTFKPNQEVNRVEALKIIMESSGISTAETTSSSSTFSDINEDEWYAEYLNTAIEKNIISGYEDGSFKPDNSVNLAEFLKIFINANQLIATAPTEEQTFFADTDKSAWYASYINFAAENGMIYADANNNINPSKNLTRADLAYIIYRYKNAEYFSGEVEFGKATYYADMFEGDHTANGEVFDQNKMTAAHLTLPFGTIVRVTNLANDKTVEVTINDRGPYADGFVLDLSKVAFQKLGYLSSGVFNIEYEIIYPQDE